MADPTDPNSNTADRLAHLLRGESVAPTAPSGTSNAGHQDHADNPQQSLLKAMRLDAEVPAPVPVRRAGKRATVNKLANPNKAGRPGVIRRPSWTADHEAPLEDIFNSYDSPPVDVDPSLLPPPLARNLTSGTESIDAAHAPTEIFNGQIRQHQSSPKTKNRKKHGAQSGPGAALMGDIGFGQPSASEILDIRVPGKAHADSPFLLPLIPATIVAALGTYLWFQAAIRLESYLPLAPILIGVAIGGIMRLGTKSVDFARVIFAVLMTAMATFWGHAATKDFGPLGRLTADKILWSDLPRVANPVGLIGSFHATAEASLSRATLMFAGLLAAGLLASLTPK